VQTETRNRQRDAGACDFTRERLTGAKIGMKGQTIIGFRLSATSVSCRQNQSFRININEDVIDFQGTVSEIVL
jgi:hypothetical protein